MQPGMPDLQQIVLKAQQMQAEMERAQASLAEAEVTGSAGGGLVTAVATASGELRSIRIDPSVVDRSDIETLEDLVVAAVHDARRAADELASQTMGSVAGGLASSLDLSSLGLGGLSLPGFGGGAVDAAIDPGLHDEDDEDDEDEELAYAKVDAAFAVNDEDDDEELAYADGDTAYEVDDEDDVGGEPVEAVKADIPLPPEGEPPTASQRGQG
jgi:nucleoid-associated protein EbfC